MLPLKKSLQEILEWLELKKHPLFVLMDEWLLTQVHYCI